MALTVIWFLISTAAMAEILFVSIQKGEWLDMIFGWQKMLRKFDVSGTLKGKILFKILGGCELCFSHLIAFLSFWIAIAVIHYLGYLSAWWMYLLAYFTYVPVATNLNLYFIKKLFKNGV